MYIGVNTLNSLLNEDRKIINWFSVSSINENKSEIEFSYGDTLTINVSIDELFEIADKCSYTLPPENDVIYRFIAINKDNILNITDENIIFKDNTEYENFFENSSILIENYQLSLNNIHYSDIIED